MKRFQVAAAALLLSTTVAAPALAQPYPHPPRPPMAAPGGWDLNRRMDWMQNRINRGMQDGSLDRREARRAEGELMRIRRDADRLRAMHGGRLWDRDRDMLQARLDRLNDHLHWMRHNDERRPW